MILVNNVKNERKAKLTNWFDSKKAVKKSELYDVPQTAGLLNVGQRSIKRYIKDHELKAEKLFYKGKSWKWVVKGAEILAFMKQFEKRRLLES